ncbi:MULTISPECIES: hypothetical protein [unclassified Haladaptatus]|uniref:hypothetical protein n=1 Tax=unclassified Haladaptatus TaxID=2622732 RepID=UPI00209BFB46|nr:MULTISPECIES: hypothetical protein [unclassified Haladaptatus]MCO8244014.1 hypothetical protein [Haladaptatus sp. AB643]MCO8255819.1 hypothetical protein [Haladaptatus sp. AB618]
MPSLSNVRPQRSHVFPFAVTASALLWFVNRDAEISGITPRTVTLGVASVAVGYLLAILVVAAVNPDDTRSGIARTLFSPSNETLAVFAIASLLLGGYAVTGFPFLPGELDFAVRLLGLTLGWPIIVTYGATVVVGNAFGGRPPFAIEAVAVEFGVACTTVWVFLLSGWVTDAVGRLSGSVGIPR